MVFDLLHLDGFDTRAAPPIERKRVLQSFLAEAGTTAPRVLYSEHFEDGADLYARAIAMSLEGIVSKRADAPYRSGRSQQWFKVKSWKRERFAVIGFVPEGSGGLLKLRLARQEGGALVYEAGYNHRSIPQGDQQNGHTVTGGVNPRKDGGESSLAVVSRRTRWPSMAKWQAL